MRKFILPLSAVALLIACNSAEKQNTTVATTNNAANTDLIQSNLKGKVKSYEEMSTTIDSSGASKKDSSSYVNEFDEKGYQTIFVTKDINEKTKAKESYTRYENGHIKEF